MHEILGSPHGAAWLQVPASLLHMIPMNLFLGGAILAAFLGFRSGPDEAALRSWLLRVLPAAGVWTLVTGFLSYGILAGITIPGAGASAGDAAPLFDGEAPGVINSHYGGVWPVVDLVLLVALAIGAILLGRRASTLLRTISQAAAVLLLAWAAFLCAAAQNVDERIHLGTAASGLHAPSLALLSGKPIPIASLVTSASSLLPRLAHLILGAVAVTGMILALHGLKVRRTEPRDGEWLIRQGAQWFSTITGVQLAIGTWLLIALPHPVRHRFFGGSPGATAVIFTGVLLAVAVMIVMTHAASAPKPSPLAAAGAAMLLLLLFVMTLIREQARYGYLARSYAASAPTPHLGRQLISVTLLLLAFTGFTTWLWKRLGEAR